MWIDYVAQWTQKEEEVLCVCVCVFERERERERERENCAYMFEREGEDCAHMCCKWDPSSSVTAFKAIEGNQAAFQKLVYVTGNLACLAMAVYKCQVMGLLPTHASDWLAFAQPQQVSVQLVGLGNILSFGQKGHPEWVICPHGLPESVICLCCLPEMDSVVRIFNPWFTKIMLEWKKEKGRGRGRGGWGGRGVGEGSPKGGKKNHKERKKSKKEKKMKFWKLFMAMCCQVIPLPGQRFFGTVKHQFFCQYNTISLNFVFQVPENPELCISNVWKGNDMDTLNVRIGHVFFYSVLVENCFGHTVEKWFECTEQNSYEMSLSSSLFCEWFDEKKLHETEPVRSVNLLKLLNYSLISSLHEAFSDVCL